MTYTAAQFAQSPAFLAIAVEDAIEAVAKANGQTVEKTAEAFALQVPAVSGKVAKLVVAAAEHCAKEANAGRLWA